jgi:hypothetical protein
MIYLKYTIAILGAWWVFNYLKCKGREMREEQENKKDFIDGNFK